MTITDNVQSLSSISEFLSNLPLSDAPPCLQSIYLKGTTSNRNEYLFSMARYLKTKYGDDFEFKITEINNALDKPLPVKELMSTIIATHKKKDYSYKCSQDPLLSLCHKDICRMREYGIGGDEVSDLSFEELKQFLTDPPYYEWVINEKPLIFYSETDLINQTKFRELCLRKLHKLPPRLKDRTWTTIINTALVNMEIHRVDVGDDISPGGILLEHLYEFLEERVQAENKNQILMDRVYKDKQTNEYVFRARNFMAFLSNQKQFRDFRSVEIQSRLKQLGGYPARYYVSNKYRTVRVWKIPFESLATYKDSDEKVKVDINFMEELEDEDF